MFATFIGGTALEQVLRITSILYHFLPPSSKHLGCSRESNEIIFLFRRAPLLDKKIRGQTGSQGKDSGRKDSQKRIML